MHNCGRYHYGDMSTVRDCCIEHYRALKVQRDRYALTEHHPAAKLETEAWNALTLAECIIITPELGYRCDCGQAHAWPCYNGPLRCECGKPSTVQAAS